MSSRGKGGKGGKGVAKSSSLKSGGKLAPAAAIDPENLPAGEIKSAALFAKAFGTHGYTINMKKTFVLSAWNTNEGRRKIRLWLISLGARFATMIDSVYRGSEYALYPLLIDTLAPVLALASCQVDPVHVEEPLPADVMEEIANDMAERSRQNSLTTREEAYEEEEEESEGDIPATIDTTNSKNLQKFMVQMEAYIRSANTKILNKGRVEIMIHESDAGELGDMLAALEAKKHVGPQGEDREGIFQLSAYLVISGVKYGIYTSHKAWQFAQLDENKEVTFTNLYPLMRDDYKQFDPQAIDVFAHLLEICRVPVTTDLVATATASAASAGARGTVLTQLLANMPDI